MKNVKKQVQIVFTFCMILLWNLSTVIFADAATVNVWVNGNFVEEITIPKGSSTYIYLRNKKDKTVDPDKVTVKDEKIAVMDDDPYLSLEKITAKKIGTTEVVFTYNGEKYTCKVTVVPKCKIKVISRKYREKDGSSVFKIKNNMKKAVTFYADGAIGDYEYGIEKAEINKEKITIEPGETQTLTVTNWAFYGVRIKAECGKNQFTYALEGDAKTSAWYAPGWMERDW